MSSFTFSHIVAASQNNVIGFQNKLPWHIPEDLKFFQNKTKHHIVIMGRKTFESLGKPLPQRTNIVITRNPNFKRNDENCFIFPTLEKAMQEAQKKSSQKEIFIAGGGEIYKLSLPFVHQIYLTRIYKNYEGDSFYPEIPSHFKQVAKKDVLGSPAYSFLKYKRS